MTPSELGKQVKSKYPGVYDQYPDEVVGQRTLVKYPQYQSMIDPPQTAWEAAKVALASRPELQPYQGAQDFKNTGDQYGLTAAEQTLAAPIRAGMTISQPGFRKAGEAVAESLGAEGINPKVSASLGLALGMVPDVAQGASAINEMLTSNAPLAQAIRNTPRDLSPRYDAVNEAAGISKNLPETRGAMARYPVTDGPPTRVPPLSPDVAPVSYPKDINTFLNFARARIQGLGDRLSAQELNDYKSIINTAINDGKIVPRTDQFAVATKLLKNDVTPLLNKAVPGRSELDQIYALSKKLRVAPEIAKKVWDYLGPKFRWGDIFVQ